MRAGVESQMRIVLTLDVDAFRIRKRVWIEVASWQEKYDPLAGLQPGTTEFRIAGHRPGRRCDAIPAEELLDRLWDQLRSGAQLGLQCGIQGEMPHTVGHGVRNRIEPCREEQYAVAVQLLDRYRAPRDRDVQQIADQIVLAARLPRTDQLPHHVPDALVATRARRLLGRHHIRHP